MPGAEVTLTLVGRKGRDFYRRRSAKILSEHINVLNRPDVSGCRRDRAGSRSAVINDGETDAVFLINNEFKSVMTPDAGGDAVAAASNCPNRTQSEAQTDYIYEQSPLDMLERLMPRYVEVAVFRAHARNGGGVSGRAHDRDGHGIVQREGSDRHADSAHEPRAPGGDHQGNYRSGQRRGGRGITSPQKGFFMATATETLSDIGHVVQIAGPAVDCQFPEGQIPEVHTAIRITSEGFDVPEPIDIICEAAAAHRRRPRPHHRDAAHRRSGARHEGHQPGRPDHAFRWARKRWAACSTCSASRWTRWVR